MNIYNNKNKNFYKVYYNLFNKDKVIFELIIGGVL